MKREKNELKNFCKILFICIFSFENIFWGGSYSISAITIELNSTSDNGSDFNSHSPVEEESSQNKNFYSETVVTEASTIATGTLGTSKWLIDSEGTLHIGEGEAGPYNTYESPWKDYKETITKIVFEGNVVAKGVFHCIFLDLGNVETIENISYLDVSNVVSLYNFFGNMKSLRSLDLSTWDTSQVTEMNYMFNGCSALTNLDLSNFETIKLKNTVAMFANCDNLTQLNVTGWDTPVLRDIRTMFSNSKSLTSLDLSSWQLESGTSMAGLFNKADSLSKISLGPGIKSLGTAVGLPDVPSDDIYTGKWINVGMGTIESPKGTNIWSSMELLNRYNGAKDADTYVWEKKLQLDVQTKQANIPLGTDISEIDLNDFIESVKLSDVELSKDEYTLELKNSIKTTKIDNQNVEIELSLKDGSNKVVEVVSIANIIWGSTLVVKNEALTAIDASVSLLHKGGQLYLNANEGSGFSMTTLTSRPNFYIYRNSILNPILTLGYGTVNRSPQDLAKEWNAKFESLNLQYGDIVGGLVNKYSNSTVNWNGQNTFVSRNNTLITETVGYDYAYYELTPSGYRLLRLNQLVVNNNQKVKLNTSKEEMNKNILNFIGLPEHIENPNDFRMEFESVDTASPGNKKSIINVYESLDSGGEFKTTYEVAYTVYPEITEFYYDVDGKQIEQSQTTEFEYGKEFAPSPEKYIENNGVLYIYKGWVDVLPGTGTIIPQEGIPAPTLVEKNYYYYYIYEKADKFINVTLPTEVVFGTFENNNKISSKKYEIRNNSDELPIEVSLERFDKVTSDIKLLSSNTPDPTQQEASAKLNLCVDNESIIPGLTETTPRQSITKIDTNASRFISLEGAYFGNMSDKNILDYKMHLKFKATKDNKN